MKKNIKKVVAVAISTLSIMNTGIFALATEEQVKTEVKENKIVWAVEPNVECDDIVPIKEIFPKYALEHIREAAGNIENTVFFYVNEKAGMMDYKGDVKLDTSMEMYINSRQGIASKKEYNIYNSDGQYVEQLYGGGGYSYHWNELDNTLYSLQPGSIDKVKDNPYNEKGTYMQGVSSIEVIIPSVYNAEELDIKFIDKFRLVNNEHELVIDEQFEEIKTDHSMGEYIIGDYAVVKKNGLWGYIKQDGTKLLDYSYEDAYPFFDGIAAVKKDGEAGFIKEDGQVVVDFIFEETRSVNDGLAWVKYDGKWGVIDVEKMMSDDGENQIDVDVNNNETTKVVENNVEKETASSTENSNTEPSENNTGNPETGDEYAYIMAMVMLLILGTVSVKIVLKSRKKED